MSQITNLEVILKTVERCNIACRYCYFFFAGDESYRLHPPYIPRPTIEKVAAFLADGARQMQLSTLQIDFHGGEPMMQKKRDFDWMCTLLRDTVGSVTRLQLAMQTNAMLVDDGWIDLFEKHRISLGVSLDGPADYHDRERVDHQGRGTHERVVHGLKRLFAAAEAGRVPTPGVLAVIDSSYDAKRLYDYLVRELGAKLFDALLPDLNPDTFGDRDPRAYGKFLCDLFDAWAGDDDPDVYIRIIRAFMGKLAGRNSFLFNQGAGSFNSAAISISSEGRLYPDDVLRSTGIWAEVDGPRIEETDLPSFLSSPIYREIASLRSQLPEKCTSCCWAEACGGGAEWNRFSKAQRFARETVYCEGLKDFYAHVVAFMVRNGRGLPEIERSLGLASTRESSQTLARV
jgi:uncharacterized protein